MKIVQTNKAYYTKIGGIESTIKTLSEGLVKKENTSVHVLTCNSNHSIRTRDKIINKVNVTYLPTYAFVTSLPISPGYFISLSKLSGDILHIHEPFPLADLSLHLYPRIKKNFSRIIVSWHSDIVRQKMVLSFYGKYIQKFLQIVDKIIVSNPNMIKNSDFLPLFKDKCEIIPIGTDLSWTDQSSSLNTYKGNIDQEHSKPIILCVGRLVYYKGIEYLIDAMQYISNVSLIIIGSGPLEIKLLKRIHRLDLDSRIKIIPEVDEKTLHSYYKTCDLLVLPSVEKSETYGIVQIEAMACGKPVICTDLGTGTTFINQHGVTGLVVPPRNSESIVEAINYILNDDNLKSKLGMQAKQKAFNEFSAEKMVQSVYQLYQDLLKT